MYGHTGKAEFVSPQAELRRAWNSSMAWKCIQGSPLVRQYFTFYLSGQNNELHSCVPGSIPHNWSNHNAVLRTRHPFRALLFFGVFPTYRKAIEKVIVEWWSGLNSTQSEYPQGCITNKIIFLGFSDFPLFFRIFRSKPLSISGSKRYFEHFEQTYFGIRTESGGLEWRL